MKTVLPISSEAIHLLQGTIKIRKLAALLHNHITQLVCSKIKTAKPPHFPLTLFYLNSYVDFTIYLAPHNKL